MNRNKLFRLLKISMVFLAAFTAVSACIPQLGVEPVSDIPPADQPPPPPGELPPGAPILYNFNSIVPVPAEMYFGPCTTEETLVTVQVSFSPVEHIAGVFLQYFYQLNDTVSSDYYTIPMAELGVGDWIGEIDAGLEAASALGTSNGRVYYVIAITDTSDNITYSSGQWLDVIYCGAPVAPPPSGPTPTSTVDPTGGLPPAATGPSILYFNYTNPVTEGETIHLEWSIENAECGVTLNGTQVNASGSQDDSVPLGNGGTTWYYILEAYGPPCDNSTYAFAEADVLIETAQAQVLNQYGASLVTNDNIDFDKPSDTGDVVLMAHPNNDANARLYFMQKSGTNTLLAGVSSQPSASDCVAAIDQWSSITVWLDEGFFFCFLTDEGHYGYFYRSGMDFNLTSKTWEVNIDITIWETP
jgi:hypothetical protein